MTDEIPRDIVSDKMSQNGQTRSNHRGAYILGPTLGEGAFAKVKLATQIHTKEKTAIKIFDKSRILDDDNDIQKFKKEINILKILRHKNIIQLYEVMESKKKLYIVMEYCERGEFFDYIVKKKTIPEMEACGLFQQIINGVEYLHEQNIIHRDLKPENILLDYNNTIKISDFGLSTFNDKNSFLQTPCGTPSYAPPEMLNGSLYKGTASDVWSCGIILYAMLCGALPFYESNEDIIVKQIMEHDYSIPSTLSPMAKDLLNNIMKIDPQERYNIEDIKAHPWFNLITPHLTPGLSIDKHRIPIDENILDMVEQYGIDKEKCREAILSHRYSTITCVYYLCVRKFVRAGGESVSDFNGKLFEEYIKDEKNRLQPGEYYGKRKEERIENATSSYKVSNADSGVKNTNNVDKSPDPTIENDNLNINKVKKENTSYAQKSNFVITSNDIITSLSNSSPKKMMDRAKPEVQNFDEKGKDEYDQNEDVQTEIKDAAYPEKENGKTEDVDAGIKQTPLLNTNSSTKNIQTYTNKISSASKSKSQKSKIIKLKNQQKKPAPSNSNKNLIKIFTSTLQKNKAKPNQQLIQQQKNNYQTIISNHHTKHSKKKEENTSSVEITPITKKKIKELSSSVTNSIIKDPSVLLDSTATLPSNETRRNKNSSNDTKTIQSIAVINSNRNSFASNSQNTSTNGNNGNKIKNKKFQYQSHCSQNFNINNVQVITSSGSTPLSTFSTTNQTTAQRKNNYKKNRNDTKDNSQHKSSPFPHDQFGLKDVENDDELSLEDVKFDNVLEYISKRLVAKSFCGSFNFPPSQPLQQPVQQPSPIKEESKVDNSSFKNTVSILHQKYKVYISKYSNKNYLNDDNNISGNNLYTLSEEQKKENGGAKIKTKKKYSNENTNFNDYNYYNTSRYNKFLDTSTNYIQGFDSRGESSVERSLSIKPNELRNFSFSPETKMKSSTRVPGLNLNASFNGNKSTSSLGKMINIGIISEDEEYTGINKGKKSYKKKKTFHGAEKKITINLSMTGKGNSNSTNSNKKFNSKPKKK